MMTHVETLVAAAAAEPACAVEELAIVPAAERRLVVEEWNAAAAPVPTPPAGATLASLFAQQAARTPDAVALVDGARELTYAELDARSARLARRLRALGVGPEARVGVFLDARGGAGRRAAGRAPGGRRVRAARPGVSARARRIHARGRRRRGW